MKIVISSQRILALVSVAMVSRNAVASTATVPKSHIDEILPVGTAVYCPASSSCHALYDVKDTDNILWHDAQLTTKDLTLPDACGMTCGAGESLKKYLVSINSQGEQDCLDSLSNAARTVVCGGSSGCGIRPWTGGYQEHLIEPAGGFAWDSGEPFYDGDCLARFETVTACDKDAWMAQMIYKNFYDPQPDNGLDREHDAEHFIELHPDNSWKWNDRRSDDLNKPSNQVFIAEFKCVKDPDSNGDPHYTTWSGEKYDYHGKCDLELMSDPEFSNGKGLRIHTRTEIVRTWSYIKAAAIQIGDDVLEVEGSRNPAERRHWINGEFNGPLTTFGGFNIVYKSNKHRRRYIIYLNDGAQIVLGSYKDWVRVDIHRPTSEIFGNTVGLFGDFERGLKVGRDGVTLIHNVDAFGQEWQVQADAPMLFHEVSGPQAPFDKCIVPEYAHAEDPVEVSQLRGRRRLLMNSVSYEQAEEACSQVGIPTKAFNECVKDVIAMDDVDFAEAHMLDFDDEEEDGVMVGSF